MGKPKRKPPTLEPWQQRFWAVPPHLSPRAMELWAELVGEEAKSPERVALLQVGLEALGTLDKCNELLAAEGLIVTNLATRTPHAHPAWAISRQASATFIQVWKTLGLEYSKHIDGEPTVKQFQPEYL